MGSLKDKVQKNWTRIIVLSIVIFVIFLTQDIIREIVLFNNEVVDLTESLDQNMRNNLQSTVEFRSSEIELIYDNVNDAFEENLTHEMVLNETSINAVLPFLSSATENEFETEVSNILINNYVDSIYSYTLLKTDGTVVYDQLEEYLPGVNILGNVDSTNREYISALLTSIEENLDSTGHVTRYMNIEGTQEQIMYYGIKLGDTDYVVFIRANLSDYLNILLQEYYDELIEFYSNKNSSVGIFSTDGDVYVHKDLTLIDTNVFVTDESTAVSAFEDILSFIDLQDKGFMKTYYYENGQESNVVELTGYVNYIEELDLIVAFSSPSDTYQQLISDFQSENLKNVLITLIPLYIIIIIIIVYVIRLIVSTNKLSFDVLDEEEQLYKLFGDISDDIILITNKKGDIIFTNKLGQKTIYPTYELTKLNIDDILFDEESCQVLVGIKQNYYIKSTVSQIVYDGVECDLYVLNDVTEKVTTERKLEAMTLADDLTGLGNRRLLVKDYKDFIVPHIKDGKLAYLAMIDLDNFKEANDKYGHTFGDDVLINISNIFKEHMDDNVKIYRVGGDEFALTVMNLSENDCVKLIRKLKNKVSTFNYGKKVNIGFSAGVTEINITDSKRRLSDYYERADELLYVAKNEGKDRIKI